jgi:NAD+ kinase
MGQRCDLAVVVGGDGTMLGIARELARVQPAAGGHQPGPAGLHHRHPARSSYRDAGPMMPATTKKSTAPCSRARSGATARPIFDGLSLNDVVVSRGATASMVELRVDIGTSSSPTARRRPDGRLAHRLHRLCAVGRRAHPAPGHRRLGDGADRLAHPVQPAHRAARRRARCASTIVAGATQSANFDMQPGQPAARRPGACGARPQGALPAPARLELLRHAAAQAALVRRSELPSVPRDNHAASPALTCAISSS